MKQSTKDTFDLYVSHGAPPGGFVLSVLRNNLISAVCTADEENLRDLVEIVKYAYNELPGNCWGSPSAVTAWIAKKAEERRKLHELD